MRILSPSLAALILMGAIASPLSASASGDPLQQFQPVGKTKLKVFWFPVYEAHLYSPDGEFRSLNHPLALRLRYLRDIDSKELVSSTRDEWQRLGLYHPDASETWLKQLASLWPDVEKGDELMFRYDGDSSHFFFNGEPLGSLSDSGFGPQFAAIWLHPNTRFPSLRRELIGEN
ncbi:chalcone isomerase family protein [Ferrimonas gelatinilytica]|uniref:Chalcone isomerase family protein n=1 Tax=Ferrimonas gelatinilytica TaxID=1255257 RepID=A0ABP9S453_9GAMM